MSKIIASTRGHSGTVVLAPLARYPHRPVCTCGLPFAGYLKAESAETVISAHVAEVKANQDAGLAL